MRSHRVAMGILLGAAVAAAGTCAVLEPDGGEAGDPSRRGPPSQVEGQSGLKPHHDRHPSLVLPLRQFALDHGTPLGFFVEYDALTVADMAGVVAGAMVGPSHASRSRNPSQDPSAQAVEVKLRGNLIIGVQKPASPDNPSAGWQMLARFEPQVENGESATPESATGDGVVQPAVARRPVLFGFRLARDGTVSGLSFPPSTAGTDEGALSAVIGAMSVTLPQQPAAEWEAREQGHLGSHVSRYTVDDHDPERFRWSLGKSRSHISVPAVPGASASISATVLSGTGTVVVGDGSGWTLGAAMAEEIEFRWDGQTVAKVSHRARIRVLELPDGVRAPAPEEVDRAMLEPPVDDGRNRDAGMLARLATRSREDMVTGFADGYRRDYATARDEMLAWLRQSPGRSRDLADWLAHHGREVDEEIELALWRLLAASGTRESQDELVRILGGRGVPELARYRAAANLGEIASLSPETAQALWDHYHANRLAADGSERELATATIYALGALGHASRNSPEISRSSAEGLAVALRSAADDREQLRVLSAIGNHGGEPLLPVIREMLNDPRDAMRAAALSATRRMDSDEAVLLLAGVWQTEKNPRVLAAAAQALAEMPPRASGIRLASARLFDGNSEEVTLPLVELLGSTIRQYPDNEATLRKLASGPVPSSIKRAVYRHIKPVRPAESG